MNNKKIKLSGIIFSGVIIIFSFFYTANIQPVVIGKSGGFKTYVKFNNFNSNHDKSDFLKNKPDYNYYLNFTSELKFVLGLPNEISTNNKIILFDLKNFENTKEVSNIIIGDYKTDNSIFYYYKSFLSDKEKDLLLSLISLYKISNEVIKLNSLDNLNENKYIKQE